MHWADLFNSVGSLFVVATASTKTMVPLRILGIIANCFLIALLRPVAPMGADGAAIHRAAAQWLPAPPDVASDQECRGAIRGNNSMDWLKPFMTERHCRKGDILFAKGETAEEMLCTVTGRYLLLELGIELKSGQVVGELGMLAPDNRRTATLECIEEGDAAIDHLPSRSRNSTIRIRPSAFTFCAWRPRGCSKTTAGWRANWRSTGRPACLTARKARAA